MSRSLWRGGAYQGASEDNFQGIQWIADRRKTKADTEERKLQEKLTRVFKGLKEMILTDGDAEEWKRRA